MWKMKIIILTGLSDLVFAFSFQFKEARSAGLKQIFWRIFKNLWKLNMRKKKHRLFFEKNQSNSKVIKFHMTEAS